MAKSKAYLEAVKRKREEYKPPSKSPPSTEGARKSLMKMHHDMTWIGPSKRA